MADSRDLTNRIVGHLEEGAAAAERGASERDHWQTLDEKRAQALPPIDYDPGEDSNAD